MCGQNETVSHAQLNYAQNHWMRLFAASFLDSWHDPLFINVHSYETVISDLNIFEKKKKTPCTNSNLVVKMLTGNCAAVVKCSAVLVATLLMCFGGFTHHFVHSKWSFLGRK